MERDKASVSESPYVRELDILQKEIESDNSALLDDPSVALFYASVISIIEGHKRNATKQSEKSIDKY